MATITPRFAYVGYWDADLSTPLTEVSRLLAALESHATRRVAIGSRWRHLGADIDRNPIRHAAGRVFATIVSNSLNLPVYDSQCGAKLFRATEAATLFADRFISRWCFDVEILARISSRAHGRVDDIVVEVALSEWRDVAGSKVRPLHLVGMLMDLWRIHRRYRRG